MFNDTHIPPGFLSLNDNASHRVSESEVKTWGEKCFAIMKIAVSQILEKHK